MGVYENILSHIHRIFHFSEYTLYFNKFKFLKRTQILNLWFSLFI